MCAKKLIERIPSEADRRVVHIIITETGKALITTIGSDLNTSLVDNLNEEEALQLNNLLDKMR